MQSARGKLHRLHASALKGVLGGVYIFAYAFLEQNKSAILQCFTYHKNSKDSANIKELAWAQKK